jgi:hypothetical protein
VFEQMRRGVDGTDVRLLGEPGRMRFVPASEWDPP